MIINSPAQLKGKSNGHSTKYLTHQINYYLFSVVLPVSPLLFCCSTFFLTSCSFSHLRTRTSHKKGRSQSAPSLHNFCHIKLGLLLTWPDVDLVMIHERGGHNSQFWTSCTRIHNFFHQTTARQYAIYLSHLKAVSDDAVIDTTAWTLVAAAICTYATVWGKQLAAETWCGRGQFLPCNRRTEYY